MQLPNILPSSSLAHAISSLQPAPSRVFILVDRLTYRYCLPELLAQVPELKGAEVLMLGHGEKDKTIRRIETVSGKMLRMGADRQSLLINLGGGIVTDAGGMLASVFKRGIRFIHIPTSLTAMIDASIGGKTGVNLGHSKNQLGVFSFPEAIILHEPFLRTLPPRHLHAGYAEMLKHGLIADPWHWNLLLEKGPEGLKEDAKLLRASIEIKQTIASADPEEKGIRAILNFGHTIGHAIETLQAQSGNLRITHGHAVALGMMVATRLSVSGSGLDDKIANEVIRQLRERFSIPKLSKATMNDILRHTRSDKKSSGGSVKYVLLKAIGEASYGVEVADEEVMEAMKSIFKVS